jgi:magnesium transporter
MINKKLAKTVEKIADVPINLLKQFSPIQIINKNLSTKVGLPPGSIVYVGEQKVEKVKITLTEYDENKVESYEINSVEEVVQFTDTPRVTWVNVCGLHETDYIRQIGEKFDIHSLVLEDLLNTETRPKIEITDNYIFISMKMLSYNKEQRDIGSEQVSFILGENFLFSFLEKSDKIFDPIRKRISSETAKIRKRQCDYLLYALMDLVVDHYFLMLEQVEEEINQLDDEVINRTDKSQIEMIYNLKTKLLLARRSIYPVREICNKLIREETDLINEKIQPFLKDLLDHIIQITETTELLREITISLMETHLSMMSNKMNEVMKVLTIIATIFIPLTFVAGIYGMNFEYMPELGWRWAYFTVWGVMIVVTIALLLFFRRKKWL